MPTKIDLERERDDLRDRLEEVRALVNAALGYDDDEDEDEED